MDLINRQDAIDAADKADYTGLAIEDVKLVTDEVVKEIKKLPSAQPTQFKNHPCAECCETDCYCCRFIEYRGKPYEME